MRNGDEMNKLDNFETIRAYYFSKPELDSIIKEKGICSYKDLLTNQMDKPYLVEQQEKEERELGVEELAPVHAFIVPPKLIGTDLGDRIFAELTRQYGYCVRSFDVQVDNAFYLYMKDPGLDVIDRVVATKNLFRLLAVSPEVVKSTSDEPLFKWLVKALVLTGPITNWQEVKIPFGGCEIPMYTILSVIYAAAVLAYGLFGEELSVTKDNFGTGIIVSIIFMSFAFFAIAVLVETLGNGSHRGVNKFYLPIFFLLAFPVSWLGLFGLFDLQIYFLYACALLLIMAMTVWIFTSVRISGKK